ncbi:hypothetical protein QL285_062013 [Trifolium repens]|nr:hypothetical protein QL285_062013 [Trifolium repens]
MTQENDNIIHEANTAEEVSIDNQVVQERPKRKTQLPKRLEDYFSTLNHYSSITTLSDNGLVEPFSECRKLSSLVISCCEVVDGQNLCISSTTLVNLTIRTYCNGSLAVLKFELNTPSLCSFAFTGNLVEKLDGNKCSFSSLTHVSIFAYRWSISADTPMVLFNWLIELANIKSLTLSSSTLEVLNLVPDLLKVEFRSLYNLKLLKVKVDQPSSSVVPDKIVKFLLQNAPSAEAEI